MKTDEMILKLETSNHSVFGCDGFRGVVILECETAKEIAARLRAAGVIVDLVRNAAETWPKLKGAIRRYEKENHVTSNL